MKVLFVRLSAMGDVVQSLGAMQAVAESRPGWQLTVVTQTAFAPLFEHVDFEVDVVPHDRRAGIGGYLRTARALRARGFDVAVDLQGNWKAAGLAWGSRASRRLGIAGAARREPSSARLLTERVDTPDSLHASAAAFAVVRALVPDAIRILPTLHATEQQIEIEAQALAGFGIDPTQPFRVLLVTHPNDPRSWPLDAMRREAASAEVPVVWLAGPDEADVALPADLPVERHAAGDLRRLVALGALCRRAGGVVVGPDQGASHVLAAAGARTRVLFGPQDPARTAPPSAEILLRADGPDCVPCRSRKCTHPDGPVCMDFTTADARVSHIREPDSQS